MGLKPRARSLTPAARAAPPGRAIRVEACGGAVIAWLFEYPGVSIRRVYSSMP